MLVILSDLHLTDGSCAATVPEEFFQILGQRLRELVWRGSWRTDGSYRPLEGIDLVLLGDTLDLLHSSRWLDDEIFPWDGPESAGARGTVERITSGVLRENAAGLQTLRSLAAGQALGLPPATRQGRPDASPGQQPVPVRLHYLVGDHDWWLHADGAGPQRLRKLVAEHLALATPADRPFPHDPLESDALLEVLRRHRVMARHGDLFDPLSYNGTRDQASLSDLVAVQLIGRFRRDLAEKMPDDLPPNLAAGLADLVHLRPLSMIPVWLEAAVARSDAPCSVKSCVRRAWNENSQRFLDCSALGQTLPQRSGPWRDWLARTLPLDAAPAACLTPPGSALPGGTSEMAGGSPPGSLAGQALLEQDFRNRRAKHIVYGHTHHWETTALDASAADGFVLNQMYFNAGTWRPAYQPTTWSRRVREFVPTEQINLLAFYQGDERSGRTFEVCSHWLAPRPPHVVQRRLDLPVAAEQGKTPGRLPIVGPHFHFRAQASRAT